MYFMFFVSGIPSSHSGLTIPHRSQGSADSDRTARGDARGRPFSALDLRRSDTSGNGDACGGGFEYQPGYFAAGYRRGYREASARLTADVGAGRDEGVRASASPPVRRISAGPRAERRSGRPDRSDWGRGSRIRTAGIERRARHLTHFSRADRTGFAAAVSPSSTTVIVYQCSSIE